MEQLTLFQAATPANQAACKENTLPKMMIDISGRNTYVINEVQPAWLINENVPGSIFNRILDGKISDLENSGYTCWPPILIPGSVTGTIHQRERVLLVAYAPRGRFEQLFATRITDQQSKREFSRKPKPITSIGIKAGHTSISRILREADGTAERLAPRERNGGIRAGGNGIVPQLAYGFMREIDRITNEYINAPHHPTRIY